MGASDQIDSERPEQPAFIPGVRCHELTGAEALKGTDGKTVLDYWRWAHSDVVENVQRGIFAEYIVAAALGISNMARIGWGGYDLKYGGNKIEVKSSAYLQSWKQRTLSRPVFSIGARKQWIEESGKYTDPRYVADCFVFCLYGDKDGPNADVLNLERWLFYIVSISNLIAALGTGKIVSLDRLNAITSSVRYAALKQRVDDALEEQLTAGAPSVAAYSEGQALPRSLRSYLVTQRKTRAHPVIVSAGNYKDAQLLARADPTIASFGTQVSAFELSHVKLERALADGAIDLRGGPRG